MFKKNKEDPIQNMQSIDIIAEKTDGMHEFYIISSGHLDGLPETQKLFRDKLEYYLAAMNGDEIKKEIKKYNLNRSIIILNCPDEPDKIFMQFFNKCIPWVKEYNTNLSIKIGKL